MKKRIMIGIVLVVLILSVVGLSRLNGSEERSALFSGQEMTLYKSQSCGCCSLYASYAEKKMGPIRVENREDMPQIKADLGVPSLLQSCHTLKIGDYFVEGHIPIEAITKLLEEKPDILGIAMPGMPSGSPGMPGAKTGDFVVYAVNRDGSSTEFMRL